MYNFLSFSIEFNILPHEYSYALFLSYEYDLPPLDPWILHNLTAIPRGIKDSVTQLQPLPQPVFKS